MSKKWMGFLAALTLAAVANAGTITFEELGTQPGTFALTNALREQYAGMGVHFFGGAVNDGGGVLNQSGGFGVNGRSGVHFLAFNPNATYQNGGKPTDPQIISFDNKQSEVSIWAAAGNGSGSYQMDAFDSGSNLIDSATASSSGATYVELKVNDAANRIVTVVLVQTGQDNAWVFDDLTFESGPGCSGNESLKVKCKKKGAADQVKATLKGGTPGQILIFCTDGGACTGIAVNGNGKAKYKASVVAACSHEVTVAPCGLAQRCVLCDSEGSTFEPPETPVIYDGVIAE